MRKKVKRLIKRIKNPVGVNAVSYTMVFLVGLFDYITDPEFSLSLFYLIPIAFSTWFSSRTNGIFVSLLSAITWFFVDISSAEYQNMIAPYWNSAIRLGFFVIVVFLLSEIKFLYKNLESMVNVRTNELTNEIRKKNIAETELRRAKNLYQDLVENINEVYFTTDENGYFGYISPNFYKALNLSETRVRNRSFYDLIYTEDVERIKQFYSSRIMEGAADASCEFRIAGADNAAHWFEQISRILWDENKENVEIRNLLKNIDERKAAEISLIKSEMNFKKLFAEEDKVPPENDYIKTMLQSNPTYLIKNLAGKVDEVFEKISSRIKQALEFSSLASHELRTPLAIIRNQLEENLREDIPFNTLKETTASIYDEVLRLQRIIGDLLNLSRMEAGKLKLQKNIVQLDKLLSSFYEEARLLAQEKNIEVRLNNTEGICMEIDKAYFQQMLFNIFDNALKHTPEKGLIHIFSECSNNTIKLLVKDSGKGIPPDVIKNLFTPFYMSTSESSPGGTGLGLLLSKWIVELHNGKIEIKSDYGNGTSVLMTFPYSA